MQSIFILDAKGLSFAFLRAGIQKYKLNKLEK